MCTALLLRGQQKRNSSTVVNSDSVTFGKPAATQGQITSTVKQRIWCLAQQLMHSPQLSIPKQFPHLQTKWKGAIEKEKTTTPYPPPPPEDKHCIFFLLESFKSVFQELSSSISSSTSSNISELRLLGSEGCFLE